MKAKAFDAVAMMREIRARREREYAGLDWEAVLRAIRARVADDPLWNALAGRARRARRAAGEDPGTTDRGG
jgi:hypothetical protein